METRKLKPGEKATILAKVNVENITELENILNRVKVAKDRGCWFIGKDWSIYTKINKRSGHRLVYELVNGSINSKLLVCHNCDRRGCVNPDHLYQGTQSDNMQDAMNKHRVFSIRVNRTELNRLRKLDAGKKMWIARNLPEFKSCLLD